MPDHMATLLLVEGRGIGSQTLSEALQKAGYHLKVVHTGKAALQWGEEHQPDLVVFDAASMRSNGARSCRRLRRALDDTPIIHTRPAGEAEDRSAEADVYLEHPFTSRKLLNRIHALLPADDNDDQTVRCGELTLYLSKPSVEVSGQGEKRLTPKLTQLLQEFISHPNEIVSRRQLMQNVWKTDYVGDTRTLDVHIRWMRELIEEDPASPKLLRTVRGQGYILAIPSEDGR
ncbi:MAG: response regulator transcription factor [Anaerolineales bacterium]|nr:response regulator transcription factor [Anaerolineales bacterium]